MKKQELAELAENGILANAFISPGAAVFNTDHLWSLCFNTTPNPSAALFLEKARGGVRFFKTIDAAYKECMSITKGNLNNISIEW